MVATRAGGDVRREHPRLRAEVGEQRGLAAGRRAGVEEPSRRACAARCAIIWEPWSWA
jgi:hypothetical protein